MRYINPADIDLCKPTNWNTNSSAWNLRVKNAADKIAEIKAIGNKWKDFKPSFISKFGDKCWYSEVPRIGTDNDVDHFRPKGGALMKNGKPAQSIVAGSTKKHSGYWWLAYSARNYRYSCIYANRAREGGGKRDYFPLDVENTRAWTPNCNYLAEDNTLIDPCNKNDVQLIAFDLTPGDAVSRFDRTQNKKAYYRFKLSDKFYNLNEQTIKKERIATYISTEKDLRLLNLVWGLPCKLKSRYIGDITRAENDIIAACDRRSKFSATAVALVKIKMAEPWLANIINKIDISP